MMCEERAVRKECAMKRWRVSACVALVWSVCALGQPGEPVLRGPKVEEVSVPGESRAFGGSLARGSSEIPHRVFLRALDALRGREAPSEVRISAEQERALREAEEAFRRDQAEYFARHREEIRGLAGALGVEAPVNIPTHRLVELLRSRVRAEAGSGRSGGGTEAGAMADPKEQAHAEAVGRLRELAEGAPKPRDLHVRLWAVLNEAQREHVLSMLRAHRDEAMAERRGQLGLSGDMGGAMQGAPKPITDINDPRLPEAVRERLAGLSERERARVLERLNERLRQEGRGGGGGRSGRESKPPPSMDEVLVPLPEEKRK
jgi:hypothetical protein